uniref:Glycosyltransferase n=1 Tax=Eiseniibacteriota bacterium TaxID=2212470 RepID=A0A832I6U0_UNCEI
MPKVSVLVPVRDAAPWLEASLASLWRQRFAEFEVVAVDDGSTDGSGALLDRIAREEPRLRVLHTRARGLPRALAAALAAARAPLVARHDADDLSHRDRLALQTAFLARHPEVAVVGCRVRLFPAAAAGAGMRRWVRWHNGLLDHDAMRRDALVDSPLCHGTALARRAWIERAGGWTERGWPEDVDLWIRLFARGARFAKLPRVLYGWRQHPGSATRRDPRYGPERFAALRREGLRRLHGRRFRAPHLVGVGASLEAWRRALAAAGGPPASVTRQGRPHARWRPPGLPLLLVFGAAPARERWRGHLASAGLQEGGDFAFVA